MTQPVYHFASEEQLLARGPIREGFRAQADDTGALFTWVNGVPIRDDHDFLGSSVELPVPIGAAATYNVAQAEIPAGKLGPNGIIHVTCWLMIFNNLAGATAFSLSLMCVRADLGTQIVGISVPVPVDTVGTSSQIRFDAMFVNQGDETAQMSGASALLFQASGSQQVVVGQYSAHVDTTQTWPFAIWIQTLNPVNLGSQCYIATIEPVRVL